MATADDDGPDDDCDDANIDDDGAPGTPSKSGRDTWRELTSGPVTGGCDRDSDAADACVLSLKAESRPTTSQ